MYSKTEAAEGSADRSHVPHDLGWILAGDGQLWNKRQFLHEQSRSRHMGRDVRSFLARITDTQLFEDFVRSHAPRVPASVRDGSTDISGSNSASVPSEVRLFDEYIAQYRATNSRNYRKKMERARENGLSLTPLLDAKKGPTPDYVNTYMVPSPSREGLTLWWRKHEVKKHIFLSRGSDAVRKFDDLDSFPEQLDPLLFGPMRPHQYLIDTAAVTGPMQRLLQAVRKRHTLTTHLERKNMIASATTAVTSLDRGYLNATREA